MKTLCLISISIIFCAFPGCKKQEKTKDVDYSAIETGLVPAVLIGDFPPTTYTIKERMDYYKVPGVSFVIFKDGKIVWSNAYGVTKAGLQKEVTPETKFQAASISKSVTALGVLKLVEKYHLDLDVPVNQYMNSWKIQGPFLKEDRVTIRKLLSHTAGTNVGAVPGYEKSDTIPNTTEVLKGKGNTPPVKLNTIPGTQFSYSGGGYIVLQQLIEDISGNSFEDYFEQEIFSPLDMTHSTFNQFPKSNVSVAHGWEGKPYPDGWRVFPAMAAAGLWTTTSDLAKFCIAIENAYYGKEDSFISQDMAKKMLPPDRKYGLGLYLGKDSETSFFSHGGSNPGGYRNFMVDVFTQRTGMIVMTNSLQGDMLHDEMIRSFSAFFNINIKEPKRIDTVQLKDSALEKLTGRYQFQKIGEYYLEVTIDSDDHLVLFDPNDGTRFTYLSVSDLFFVEKNDGSELIFEIDSLSGKVKYANFSGVHTFYKVD